MAHGHPQNAFILTYIGEVTNPVTGVVENSEYTFSVYPNPVIDNLVIDYAAVEDGHIQIFTPMGQLIYDHILTPSSVKHIVPASGLAPGVYFIKFDNGAQQVVKKVLKINR